ncbi:hypothetical protein [Hyalangium rubrum]|uniref:Lipoprotein n=1 Tax=Hyalangium rubrum TaxID=3103134 RepID=A0ABU5H1E5_9BACT|nr:hypothetical protein [Hyalangium sp. s54d21]MDY7227269.1 hypothetical protein [Hyalangium sp. s54d21]
MRSSYRILLLTLPLLTVGCGDLFYVEAETEELCKTQRDLSFPAGLPLPGSVQQTFLFPVSDITATIPAGDTESVLRVRSFTLKATSGNPELSGIEKASLTLRLQNQSRPTTLLEYRRAANQPSTQTLSATGNGTLDLQELIREEELELTMEASGALPPRAWTADLTVCAGLRLKADFFDMIF